MDGIPGCLLWGCATLVFLATSGCASTNVHFLRSVSVPPLPNVLPAPDEFKLTFGVVNETPNAVQVGAVKVEVKTMYFTPYNNGACQKDLAISVPYLDPDNGKFLVKEKEFGDDIGSPCRCYKNDCHGSIWIRLRSAATNAPLKGPNSWLQITWTEPGDLANLTVVDLSD